MLRLGVKGGTWPFPIFDRSIPHSFSFSFPPLLDTACRSLLTLLSPSWHLATTMTGGSSSSRSGSPSPTRMRRPRSTARPAWPRSPTCSSLAVLRVGAPAASCPNPASSSLQAATAACCPVSQHHRSGVYLVSAGAAVSEPFCVNHHTSCQSSVIRSLSTPDFITFDQTPNQPTNHTDLRQSHAEDLAEEWKAAGAQPSNAAERECIL